ncbi:hypothetical protein CHLRE_09g389763v5 [Chlamydomonas reinhardtii]|uniref:Hydroxyproline O-arabinosyltransferase-like domain-containing protein n=1 Tax=Chlamydomonas reinhardtii TaxID=3055 RepID=A8J175_CHLRE|nr:uncharacterized protein CHLRE_09g389763v5 [Chlamydomonas reinhardtii]PNW78775.1 hypothetical protein CHLRE_09g389763v5 [Chlamydomonas reinhardtii]|eukprot:XP_001695060.1 predicted protein [Chlamydomonas reinhardtii]
MKAGAKAGAKKTNSYGTFIIIICFSVGLLGGYILLGSPHTAEHVVKADGSLSSAGSAGGAVRTWTSRRELFTPKSSSHSVSGASASSSSPELPQNVALGNKPPANGDVSKEMAAALKQQQSDKSEQGAAKDDSKTAADLMKAQQSDKSENKAAVSNTEAQAKSAVTGGAAASATTTTTAATTTATTNTAAAGTATTGATATAVATAKPANGVFPDANKWPITPVKEKMPGNTVHTLFTSNGSPYQNIQARIMVGTYNIVRKMPGGERLVALTRILHRTTPDEVMDEIPTFIAQPLQPDCDKWCWFPVADRANAMQQFIDAAEKDPSMLKAPWLLLLETDYVWMKPLPDPGDAYDRSVPGWSFGFDYIAPSIPIIVKLLKERCPDCDPKDVPNSGPAPVLARFSDFKAATPIWEDLSKWIETHEEAKKQLGWVREMYAWDIGVAANKLNIKNLPPPSSPLISQPPHDRAIGNASMYHYTWGSIYKRPGVEKEIWMFDKRTYTAYEHQLKLPLIPMPPEWSEGITLQDGLGVTKELHGTVVDMISRMNEAIKQLPDLTESVAKKKAEEEAKAKAATTAAAGATTV